MAKFEFSASQMNSDLMSTRKTDHIDLAMVSQVLETDPRFYYEPMLKPHPDNSIKEKEFAGKALGAPIWVSSMTGGTKHAGIINKNLARACGKYKMGMGLGSCRALLHSNEHLEDFLVRKLCGDDVLLYANLGIAQVEKLIHENKFHLLNQLVDKTETNGLIIHVNPMQEWLQPEGDRIKESPVNTISEVIEKTNLKLIVKEVGQGMGPESLKSLMKMPLVAIDFGAHGGTNFAMLELFRGDEQRREVFEPLTNIGHSAAEMILMVNEILEGSNTFNCREFIISGGVKSFLDGYYLSQNLNANSIYGQASAFLKHAMESFELLDEYVASQVSGLALCEQFLKVKPLK
ncbi:MAG: type 2 isopentenyl-diphosphate Delta-isomerase [Flavobacteriales bacterium]|nr:type 2 isopentenyl-diphosphate Delta-isomerase [Flavobacteriales bacterium]